MMLAASRVAWAYVKLPAIRALPPVNPARTASEDTTTPFTEMASSLPGGLSVLIRPVDQVLGDLPVASQQEGGPLQPVLMTRDKVGEAVRLAHLHSSLPVEGNDALIKAHGCLDSARNCRALLAMERPVRPERADLLQRACVPGVAFRRGKL